MAYQTDNEYVLSVKPLTEQEKKDKKKDFEFSGEVLSFNFQDIEVRAILQIIADFTDLNLVASDTVQGRITLRLKNVPWDQALSLVLKTKGLDKRVDGNVMMIAPAAEIAEREPRVIDKKTVRRIGAPTNSNICVSVMPMQAKCLRCLVVALVDREPLQVVEVTNQLVVFYRSVGKLL